MNEKRALAVMASITSTLYEKGNPITPASHIYLLLGCDIGEYQRMAYALQKSGLAKVTSETIQLTDKGMEVGKKFSEMIENKA